MTTTPTLSQLQRGLAISEKIAALESELASIFNGSVPTSAAKAAPAQAHGRKGEQSAATIAKMKASQQARWAKVKAPAAPKAPVKKKGGMSAEGRARIVAAQKARWAKIKGKKPTAAPQAPAKATVEAPVKKRTMSPETKAKLAAAMTQRWTYAKAGKGPAPTASKKK